MGLLTRYRAMRDRSRYLFSLLEPEAFNKAAIPLRHPIRFYAGHLAAFNANQIQNAGLIAHSPSKELSALFARGIDPENLSAAEKVAITQWPERPIVSDYVDQVDALTEAAFRRDEKREVLYTCLEHEEMHQETLVYLMHQLTFDLKRKPAGPQRSESVPVALDRSPIRVPAGEALLGARLGAEFGWDNEYPPHDVWVDGFELDSHKVTNSEFRTFIDAGGYDDRALWPEHLWQELQFESRRHPQFWLNQNGAWYYQGMFEAIPLPETWPALVSHAEASAYARWKGCRLPTEAEYHRAGELGGQTAPQPSSDLESWDFHAVNDAALQRDSRGLVELVGNGWEWTSTVFAGFPGFQPMPHYPGYSADFFDGRHFVVMGASPATPRVLIRPSFRNWYRENYQYAYTTFRCARDIPHGE